MVLNPSLSHGDEMILVCDVLICGFHYLSFSAFHSDGWCVHDVDVSVVGLVMSWMVCLDLMNVLSP